MDLNLQEYTELGETSVLEEGFIKISHIAFILFLLHHIIEPENNLGWKGPYRSP